MQRFLACWFVTYVPEFADESVPANAQEALVYRVAIQMLIFAEHWPVENVANDGEYVYRHETENGHPNKRLSWYTYICAEPAYEH